MQRDIVTFSSSALIPKRWWHSSADLRNSISLGVDGILECFGLLEMEWQGSMGGGDRLVLHVVVYFIWRERNNRCFRDQERSASQLVHQIQCAVWARLTTLRLRPSIQSYALCHIWRLPRDQVLPPHWVVACLLLVLAFVILFSAVPLVPCVRCCLSCWGLLRLQFSYSWLVQQACFPRWIVAFDHFQAFVYIVFYFAFPTFFLSLAFFFSFGPMGDRCYVHAPGFWLVQGMPWP